MTGRVQLEVTMERSIARDELEQERHFEYVDCRERDEREKCPCA